MAIKVLPPSLAIRAASSGRPARLHDAKRVVAASERNCRAIRSTRLEPVALLSVRGYLFGAYEARRRDYFVAGHDAPIIAQRAATRGRSAAEGGDERGGVKRNDETRDAHARR